MSLSSVARVVTLGLAASAILHAETASAAEPTKLECVRTNESAQDLRRAGKLREAIEQFEACARRSCPKVLRDDCVENAAEARAARPRVVFSVKDALDGSDVIADIRIDGGEAKASTELAKATLEPGDHVFEFRAAGYVARSKTAHLEEKQEVQITVELEKDAHETSAMAPSPAPIEMPSHDTTQRTVSYVLGGAGIIALGVGSYFGLAASETYDDAVRSCDAAVDGRRACGPSALAKGDDADTQALASTISFVAGAALLTGALALFLTAPKDPRSAFAPIRWDFASAGRR